MSALSIIKSSTELLVSVGAGAVVGNAIKATLPNQANLVNKIAIGVGGFVISGMVGEYASKYAVANIESAAEQVRRVKDAVNINKTDNSFEVSIDPE